MWDSTPPLPTVTVKTIGGKIHQNAIFWGQAVSIEKGQFSLNVGGTVLTVAMLAVECDFTYGTSSLWLGREYRQKRNWEWEKEEADTGLFERQFVDLLQSLLQLSSDTSFFQKIAQFINSVTQTLLAIGYRTTRL